MSDFTAIRVISLSSALGRRKDFARNMPLGRYSFFDAHTELCADLDYDPDRARRKSGRTIQPKEVACYSSHYAVWDWFLTTGARQLLVLEDDVMLDWSFMERIVDINFKSQNIHFIRLFTKLPPQWTYIKTPYLTPYHHLIRITGFAHGAQAYLLTREGAVLLMEKAKVLDYSIDMFLDRYWDHGLPDLAIYPFQVIERAIPSSIGDERLVPEPLSQRDRMAYVRKRALDKLTIMRNQMGFDPQGFAKNLKPDL